MIAPGQPVHAADLVYAGSFEDRYNSPGPPVMRADAAGLPALADRRGRSTVLLDGAGAPKATAPSSTA
jgi:hypothetical protein